MFSFLKGNKETSNKQNSSSDLPDSSELSNNSDTDLSRDVSSPFSEGIMTKIKTDPKLEKNIHDSV